MICERPFWVVCRWISELHALAARALLVFAAGQEARIGRAPCKSESAMGDQREL